MEKFKGKGSNAFIKAQEEVSKSKTPATSVNTGRARKKRETKEQMSIMLTPTHKKEVRELANELDLSVSELFGEWIDEKYNQK